MHQAWLELTPNNTKTDFDATANGNSAAAQPVGELYKLMTSITVGPNATAIFALGMLKQLELFSW